MGLIVLSADADFAILRGPVMTPTARGGIAPRWGALSRGVRLPRAALRLPWAIEYDPFGVESRGENDVKKAGRSLRERAGVRAVGVANGLGIQ